MNAAFSLEIPKFTRALPVKIATLLLSFLLPLLSIGMVELASSGQDEGIISAKLSGVYLGEGWIGAAGFLGMIYSVAFLLAAGFVASWCFGREFTEHKIGSYFAISTSRASIATAKGIIITLWGISTSIVAVGVLFFAGLLAGYGFPTQTDLISILKAFTIAILTTLLTLPFCAIATLSRGYLGAIGILIGLIAVTEISVVLGAGPWSPYATMGLWSGMGGPELTQSVQLIQLLIPIPIAIASMGITAYLWQRLTQK